MKTEILEYKNNKIFFDLTNKDNIMVNATQMAKSFGKSTKDFLRTQEIKEYVKILSKRLNIPLADLLIVKKGGVPGENGTWMNRKLALRFAQWLNPSFSITVDLFLEELLTKGTVNLFKPIGGVYPIIRNGLVGYPRRELLIASGYSPNSGMVGTLRKRFSEHFFTIARTACLSPGFAELRYQQGKVRQLELNFTNTHKTRVLDNQFVNTL